MYIRIVFLVISQLTLGYSSGGRALPEVQQLHEEMSKRPHTFDTEVLVGGLYIIINITGPPFGFQLLFWERVEKAVHFLEKDTPEYYGPMLLA